MKIIDHNTRPVEYYINNLPNLEIRYLNVRTDLTGSWIIENATQTVIGHIEYDSSRIWLKDRKYLQAIQGAVYKYEQVSGRDIQIIIDAQFRPRPPIKWLLA